ncbi:SP_0009 family protein [Streptococcus infantis]
MENLLDIIEKFLSQSDEKLDELTQKNHLLRLQEEEGKKNA